MKRVHAPATSIVDAPRAEPLQAPPEAPPRARIGRPATNPRTIARQQAEDAARAAGQPLAGPVSSASMMKPEEMMPLTLGVLRLVALGIKGDAPTIPEVELVNGPATLVANKYAMTTKYGPEFALLGAVIVVGAQMKQRAKEKAAAGKPAAKGGDNRRVAEQNRGDSRPQGLRQEPGVPLAVVEAIEGARRGPDAGV